MGITQLLIICVFEGRFSHFRQRHFILSWFILHISQSMLKMVCAALVPLDYDDTRLVFPCHQIEIIWLITPLPCQVCAILCAIDLA